MLMSVSKILVVLVIVECVTSVEFYKSRRVPPKYKEIRRKFLPMNQEVNVDSKIIETSTDKSTDLEELPIDVNITAETQPTLPNTTVKPKRRKFNSRPLKNNGQNARSSQSERFAELNTDQDEVAIGNVQNSGDKTAKTYDIIKPRRRTLNLYSLKRNQENIESIPVKTLIKEKTQDKASLESISDKQTDEIQLSISTTTINSDAEEFNIPITTIKPQMQPSLSITTIKPKIRTFNPRPLKNRDANAGRQSVETIANDNNNKGKVFVSNVQPSVEKKPSMTSSNIQPKRRTLNRYSSKSKTDSVQSETKETFANGNPETEISGNLKINEDNKPGFTTSTIKPKEEILDLDSFKNGDININLKPVKIFVKEKEEPISYAQTNADVKHDVTTSLIETNIHNADTESLKINIDIPSSTSDEPLINKKPNSRNHQERVSSDNVEVDIITVDSKPTLVLSTEKPRRRNLNSATRPGNGSKRIVKAQRRIIVQNEPNIISSTVPYISKNERSQLEEVATKASQQHENYYPSTTPYTVLEKTTQEHDKFIPIVGVQNYVYAYSGDYHYSYEGGDGTKAFERGELMPVEGGASGPGVVGGYSYKDKDGNDFSLSYTAGKDGYQPVGAHLPTPPPIPPAIQRVLRILATKTTPEPITERINSEY